MESFQDLRHGGFIGLSSGFHVLLPLLIQRSSVIISVFRRSRRHNCSFDYIATWGLALLLVYPVAPPTLGRHQWNTAIQQSMLRRLGVFLYPDKFTNCINTAVYSNFKPIRICLPATFLCCSATLPLSSWQLLFHWYQQIKCIQPFHQARTALFLTQICPIDAHCFEKYICRQRPFWHWDYFWCHVPWCPTVANNSACQPV